MKTIYINREAVFFEMEFQSSGASDDWVIAGMQCFGQVTGDAF